MSTEVGYLHEIIGYIRGGLSQTEGDVVLSRGIAEQMLTELSAVCDKYQEDIEYMDSLT